ncbi:MAG: thiamine pyrophosphate-dependent dehydrogenase E1 component subunit alpha [Pseudomonadota bacterium]
MTTDTTPQFRPEPEPVAPVQLLDENGVLRDGAKPSMSDGQMLEALRLMVYGRAFDTKSFSLQRQGKLGTFAPLVGQEASIVGSALATDPARDWLVPQYREAPALIRHGHSALRIALYRMGHPEGGRIDPGVRVMQFNISLAAQIPHAVGLGWGMRMQGEDGVAVAYFGEGSSSEGDFHESANLAGVVKAPVVFFLQNNQWAISTPREIQSNATDLAARAPGYGIPGVSVDGNDLLAVYQVTAEAVARARAGEGATLIEAHTFRMWAHTTADDPTRYVNPEVKERWAKRDPVERIQKYLGTRGLWDDERTEALQAEVDAEIEAVFQQASAYPAPDANEIYRHTFADETPAISRQRNWHLGG